MVSSRRLRVEQKKMVSQILLFLGLTIVVIGIFVGIIIPGILRVLGGGTPSSNTDDGVPPQIPTLSSPVSATSSAQLTLRGYNDKNNEVVILKNGQELKRIHPADDGSFSLPVDLDNGTNTFTLFSVNSFGKESAVSPTYTVTLDTEAPKLTVTEPTDKQTVQGRKNQIIVVKGQADPNSKITLNDRLIFAKPDGSFNTTHKLEIGDNTLSIKAIDQAGNMTEQLVTVSYAE